jgi:hypothetical protein
MLEVYGIASLRKIEICCQSVLRKQSGARDMEHVSNMQLGSLFLFVDFIFQGLEIGKLG